MVSYTIEKGAQQALRKCLSLKNNEEVVIITDVETLDIGVAFLKEAKKITPKIKLFILEDFGERPLKSVPNILKSAIKTADVGLYVATGKKGEQQSFRRTLLDECNNSKIRFANMINITQQIMEQGMCSDYDIINIFSERLYDLLQKAIQIRVTTKAGTDLLFEFSSDTRWINSNGRITDTYWGNLPGGEIYTSPKNVNGKVVIDGVLGDFFSEKYGLIDKTPLFVEIKKGRVIKAKCNEKDIDIDFMDYLKIDENANRVGEFAMGTNLGIKKLIGRLLQDEKMPGVHLAFGHGYPEYTGCTWKSKAHLDAVIRKPTVYVNGKVVMKEGVYTI